MGINHVGQGSPVAQSAGASKKQAQKPVESPSPAPAAKKDTAIISEKAKDLAALKAGRAAAEEAQESMSAKEQEAM